MTFVAIALTQGPLLEANQRDYTNAKFSLIIQSKMVLKPHRGYGNIVVMRGYDFDSTFMMSLAPLGKNPRLPLHKERTYAIVNGRPTIPPKITDPLIFFITSNSSSDMWWPGSALRDYLLYPLRGTSLFGSARGSQDDDVSHGRTEVLKKHVCHKFVRKLARSYDPAGNFESVETIWLRQKDYSTQRIEWEIKQVKPTDWLVIHKLKLVAWRED